MITKMNKYSFILFQPDLEGFIESIRDLGMIDITRATRPIDDTSLKLLDSIKKYSALTKRLESFNIKYGKEDARPAPPVNNEPQELFNILEASFTQFDTLIQEKDNLQRERTESEPWGVFDREDITKLEEIGILVHFFAVLEVGFKDEWNQKYRVQELNRSGSKIYFAVLTLPQEELELGIAESKFPQRSYVELDKLIVDIDATIESTTNEILSIAQKIDTLTIGIKQNHKKLDSYFAISSSRNEVEGNVAILNGFAPVNNSEHIQKFLENEGCYYITESAKIEDNPPVKLRNNWFTRLFEPIGELYMMPSYGELDLTPYFAPFYMFFFGFCFGDMGYGIILLLGGALAKLKFKQFKSYITLVQFLGLGAIIMAALSGTFFGAKIYELFTLPDYINKLFLNDLQMFWLAILFGLVQIIFARILRAIDSMLRYGWQYGLSNIGWTLVVIWAAVSYSATMLPELKAGPVFNYLTGGLGALLIVFFSETKGNIIKRFFQGTFALYDITAIFGDLLSYIRLFGLGTSGGILGLVVNSVAMNMLGIPYIGWFFTGLMLLIGHTAVLALSSLGAFVHPMRLTFVEFYKNMGFTGGGKTYNPIKRD